MFKLLYNSYIRIIMSKNKHKVYLDIATSLSKLSKCKKANVACLIVNNGRIISTGVNGTPSGYTNCCDKFKDHTNEDFLAEHSKWSLKHEIHAEMNTLLFATKNGIQIPKNSILYCTHEPCDNCLKHIAGIGINTVYYKEKYYDNVLENTFEIKIIQLNE